MIFPFTWHPWRLFWRFVWNVSEWCHLPLPNAPAVFGRCIGAKGTARHPASRE